MTMRPSNSISCSATPRSRRASDNWPNAGSASSPRTRRRSDFEAGPHRSRWLKDMTARVAIIGRPNVGKSTLFNRLVGRRLALVDDQPGVTRDRREAQARLGDLTFTAIDTAGLEEAAPESLSGRMQEQTQAAIDAADALMFLIDARAGP